MSCVYGERLALPSDDKDIMRVSELIGGPNGKKPPAVFWRDRAKQYMSYIGFRQATKGPNRGRRVRAAHYLGRDRREAMLNALLLDRRWDKVVAEEKLRIRSLREGTLKGHAYLFEGSHLPVWPTDDLMHRREMSLDELTETGRVITAEAGDDDDGGTPVVTLASLRRLFLAAQKKRIGLIGRQGLKDGTYRELVKASHTVLKAIDEKTNALRLTREHCRMVSEYWSSPERRISERTAGNYCKAFLRMLAWAENEELNGFIRPKTKDLFVFSNGRGKILPFEQQKMLALIKASTRRCRLYLLLGLNTGFTQVDIAHLKRSEIVKSSGTHSSSGGGTRPRTKTISNRSTTYGLRQRSCSKSRWPTTIPEIWLC